LRVEAGLEVTNVGDEFHGNILLPVSSGRGRREFLPDVAERFGVALAQ
jgi:hypothetical protein